jgi:hypothetical protein
LEPIRGYFGKCSIWSFGLLQQLQGSFGRFILPSILEIADWHGFQQSCLFNGAAGLFVLRIVMAIAGQLKIYRLIYRLLQLFSEFVW